MARKNQLLTLSQLIEKGDGALTPEKKKSSEKTTSEETANVSFDNGQGENKRGRLRKRKCRSFKKSLESILSTVISPETVPLAVRSTPFGDNITYQEAILIAQILKAASGDTSASVFIRDASGNKLKEKADDEPRRLEDLF